MGLAKTLHCRNIDMDQIGGYHNGPGPDRGSREPRRLRSANSPCSESVPGSSPPPDPNKAPGFPRVWSRCRVCSGGGDVELTKPDRFRPPPSIHENPESVRDGRTAAREGIASAPLVVLPVFVRFAVMQAGLEVSLSAVGPVISVLAGLSDRN